MNKKTICKWGINDVRYNIHTYEKIDGKLTIKSRCPYYEDWVGMIRRCYDNRHLRMYPTYIGSTVCGEWRYLSKFIGWVDSQPNKNWMSCCLDKDLIVTGNKCYSPDTCVYIPVELNSFIVTRSSKSSETLLGVKHEPRNTVKPFEAFCKDPFKIKTSYLGAFYVELEAHKAWQAKKHEYACALANLQDDPRVAKALRERYAPDKDWTKM